MEVKKQMMEKNFQFLIITYTDKSQFNKRNIH